MAEIVAGIGLAASIITLLEASNKLSKRLKDFSEAGSDVPESLKSVVTKLRLISADLRKIQSKAQSQSLDEDSTQALEDIIKHLGSKVCYLQAEIDDVLPSVGDSRSAKYKKAFQSLAKNSNIKSTLKDILEHIDILIFHHTTTQIESQDLVMKSLKRRGTNLGEEQFDQSNAKHGVYWGHAPLIDNDAFIGRIAELQDLESLLSPGQSLDNRTVALTAMGGMGKTQLAIAYVRRTMHKYAYIFWLRANDRVTLERDIGDLCKDVCDVPNAAEDYQRHSIDMFREWLNNIEHKGYLLVLDNYDDPNLPGNRSATGYDIRDAFPTRQHGDILITTRSTKLYFAKQFPLAKFVDVDQAVAILSQRSGQDLSQDPAALKLAHRLDGLALALAMAGTDLGQTSMGPAEYLSEYETAWLDLYGDTELFEYEDRTLPSTWSLSFGHVEAQNALAANLLRFFAYFDNSNIWYELIKAASPHGPDWIGEVTNTRTRFEKAMTVLSNYNLVQLDTDMYSMHPCLHDWLRASFATPPNEDLYSAAFMCLIDMIPSNFNSFGIHVFQRKNYTTNARLFGHLQRLQIPAFQRLWQNHMVHPERALGVGRILGRMRHYEQSRVIFESLLKQQDDSTKISTDIAIVASECLHSIYDELKLFDKAAKHLQRLQEHYDRTNGKHSNQAARIRRQTATHHLRRADLVQAKYMLDVAADSLQRTPQADFMSIIFVGLWQQWLKILDGGSLDGCEIAFENLLEQCKNSLGRDDSQHPLMIECVLFLNHVYLRQGQFAKGDHLAHIFLRYRKTDDKIGRNCVLVSQRLGRWFQICGFPSFIPDIHRQIIGALEATFGLTDSLTIMAYAAVADQPELTLAEGEYGRIVAKGLYCTQKVLFEQTQFDDTFRGYVTRLTLPCIRLAIPSADFRDFHVRNLIKLKQDHWLGWPTPYRIARALLASGDETNFRFIMAYMLKAGLSTTGLLGGRTGAVCNGCGESIFKSVVHCCKTCPTVDLCGQCIQKYDSSDFTPEISSNCEGHQMVRVDSEATAIDEPNLLDETQSKQWVEKLRQQYEKDMDVEDMRRRQTVLLEKMLGISDHEKAVVSHERSSSASKISS